MGIFYVDMEIGDPSGRSFETVEALVDTGASYTVMPPSLLGSWALFPILGECLSWRTEPA